MNSKEENTIAIFLSKTLTEKVLTASSGLTFFFLCMILPLVGPAGSKMAHASKNKIAFLGVLLFTFVLAAFTSYSKMIRRRADEGPLPYWSFGLCAVCVLTLLIVLVDGFSI